MLCPHALPACSACACPHALPAPAHMLCPRALPACSARTLCAVRRPRPFRQLCHHARTQP
eukprot:2057083-Prymnesium_polylepis.1